MRATRIPRIGGATKCKIRACALSKKLAECTECKEFMTCENREALRKVRTGALKVGMLVKIDKDKADQQQLIKKMDCRNHRQIPQLRYLVRTRFQLKENCM